MEGVSAVVTKSVSYPFTLSDAGRSFSKRPKQRNDCTVRAIALVFGINYDVAYDILKSNGRKSGQGYEFREWTEQAQIDGKKLEWQAFKAVKGQRRMNPVAFTQQFPKGRFIARTAGHVFAIIDGIVYDDTPEREDRCIYGVWRIV